MKEIELAIKSFEYRAFQFALFKRKVDFTKYHVVFGNKSIYVNEIEAIRIGRLNKMAIDKIAQARFYVDIMDSNKQCIKINFSYAASQGSIQPYEALYTNLLIEVQPIVDYLIEQSIHRLNIGYTVEFDDCQIRNEGIEFKAALFGKSKLIPWKDLSLTNGNGFLAFYANQKEVKRLSYLTTWNMQVIEQVCRRYLMQ